MRTLIVLIAVTFVSTTARAQTTLAGTVKEAASGAVLPGVTVEASSQVLTEKSRTATTDGTGHYRLENLGPGSYNVTFTLPGFSTLKVTGVKLAGADVAVDAEMKIHGIAETFVATCGMTVVPGDSTIDPKLTQHPPTNAPTPSIRIVPVPACRK
jgi:hypothetical protein